MALVAEDGTGMANAESYCTLAYATARHSSLGNAAWAAIVDDATRETFLRRATAYMLQAYRARWTGQRLNSTQALDWPRYNVTVDGYPVASNIVPSEVANACADLALKASSTDLAPDLERPIVREKIGPIETEYSPYSRQSTAYRAIDMTLAPFLSGGANMAPLVRC